MEEDSSCSIFAIAEAYLVKMAWKSAVVRAESRQKKCIFINNTAIMISEQKLMRTHELWLVLFSV